MIFHQPSNSRSNHNCNRTFFTDTVWEHHFHKNLELLYVLRGSLFCTVNGRSETLNEGDFSLALPYDIHSYTPAPHTEYWVLVFSEDFVHSFAREIQGKSGVGFRFRADHTLEAYVRERLIFGKEPSLYSLKSCLYGICEAYLAAVPLIQKDRKHQETFAQIADYIRERHTEGVTLSDVAEEFHLDYHYMSRYFKKMFHMSFSNFVNLYRLETALTLLDNTDDPIVDIAFKSGFQSVRSFNLFFQKTLQISPSEYRKKA